MEHADSKNNLQHDEKNTPHFIRLSSGVCKWERNTEDYRGTKSITRSGKVCQRWDSDYPHDVLYVITGFCLILCHSFIFFIIFLKFFWIFLLQLCTRQQPSPSLESNFCRNPDELSDGPWCYTTDPNTRWEYCDIPSCTGRIHKSFILYLILFYFIFI